MDNTVTLSIISKLTTSLSAQQHFHETLTLKELQSEEIVIKHCKIYAQQIMRKMKQILLEHCHFSTFELS